MRALQDRGRADVLLLFAYGVFRTGENHHDAVIAVIDGLLHRNRISDAPVVIRDAVDHIRFARHRHRRRRLHDVVIVVADVRLVEILRGTIVRIAGHHGEFGRIRRKRLVIHRILAIVVAQRAVHIIEVRVIVVLHIAVEARVFLTERVLRVERVVSPVLSGNVGNHIGAAGGNTIAMVDMYAVLQHAVHHTRAVNRAETAADVDHRCPVGHMRPSFRKSVPFAGFSFDFTRSVGTFALSDQAATAPTARFVRKCRNWPDRCCLPRLPERACPTIRAPRQGDARCLHCRR